MAAPIAPEILALIAPEILAEITSIVAEVLPVTPPVIPEILALIAKLRRRGKATAEVATVLPEILPIVLPIGTKILSVVPPIGTEILSVVPPVGTEILSVVPPVGTEILPVVALLHLGDLRLLGLELGLHLGPRLWLELGLRKFARLEVAPGPVDSYLRYIPAGRCSDWVGTLELTLLEHRSGGGCLKLARAGIGTLGACVTTVNLALLAELQPRRIASLVLGKGYTGDQRDSREQTDEK